MRKPQAMTMILAAVLAVAGLAFETTSDPWSPADVVSADDLAEQIKKAGPGDRVLLHVGFPVLYRASHIPGSAYAGPGAKAEGIAELKKVLAHVPRDRRILIYCGCCPWTQCPNIRPAYRAARDMGFTAVKVISIPTNLRKDWSDKGYPIERARSETPDTSAKQ